VPGLHLLPAPFTIQAMGKAFKADLNEVEPSSKEKKVKIPELWGFRPCRAVRVAELYAEFSIRSGLAG